MARFIISLPTALESQLRTDALESGKAISALVGEYVQEHYDGTVYLAYLDVWQRHVTALEDPEIKEIALGGPDTTVRIGTGELQAQLERCLHALRNAITRMKTCKDAAASQDEQVQQLQTDLTAAFGTIEGLEQGSQELMKQAEQERASKEAVRSGLQHELERTQDKLAHAQSDIVRLKGQISDLKNDKE